MASGNLPRRAARRSIRKRLIGLLLLAGLLPMIIASVVTDIYVLGEMENSIGAGLHKIALLTRDKTDMALEDEIDDVERIAHTAMDLRQAVEENNKRYEGRSESEILDEMCRLDERWIKAADDNDFIRECLGAKTSKILAAYLNTAPERFAEMLLADGRGALVGATGRTSDYYQADEKWWQCAYNGGKGATFVDEIHFDESAGVVSLDIAAPVMDESGERAVGVLKVVVRAEYILKELTGTYLGSTGHANLITSAGDVLACENGQAGGERLSGEVLQRLFSAETKWHFGEKGGCEHDDSAAIYSLAPLKTMDAVSPESFGGARWYVMVEQNTSEAFASVHRLAVFLALIGGAAAIVIMLCGFWFAGRIALPIRILRESVEQIGAGRLDHCLNIRTGDEIEQLADDFNRMAGKLAAAHDSLEGKVAERTAELAEKMRQIEKAEKRQRLILENSPVPMMIVDTGHGIVEINDSALSLMNRRREDVVGEKCDCVLRLAPDHKCPVFDEKNNLDYSERVLVNSRGEEIPILKRAVPIEMEGETLLLEAFVDISDQKRAEKEMKSAHDFLQTVIDSISDPVIVIDHNCRIVLANRASCETGGHKDPVGEGMTCHAFSHHRSTPCEGEKDPCPLKQVLATGRPFTVRHTHYDSEGRERIVEIVASPIIEEGGRVVRVIEISRDITEREKARKEIETLKQQIEFILGATKTGLDIIDSNFNVVYVDPEWQKAYGDPTGRKCHEYFMGRTDMCPNCGIPKALETKAVTVTEEVLAKEGNRPVQVTTIPFQNEKGEWLVAEVNVDITERKRVEEALRKSEEWLATTLRSIGDAVIVADTEARVTFINYVAEQLTGWKQEEAAGRPIEEIFNIVNEQTDEKAANPVEAVIKDGITLGLANHTALIARDGTRRPIDDSAAPIVNDAGEIIGAILVFRDISERRQIERQLVHSEKMAGIGQLAAGVAHEINNPTGFVASNLNTMNDYAADLTTVLRECKSLFSACASLEGGIGETARKADELWKKCDIDYILDDMGNLVKESLDGAGRIKKIIADLKDFTRADRQEVEEIDLNEAIDKTLNVAWNEIKYKAKVVKEYGELPPVKCIAGQIDQALLNIIVNAAQAIEKTGVITIRTLADDDQVCVEIGDTGPGIKPEIIDRIFDPFFTTKPVGKGTGLGLNITYNIIQQHNGTVTVRSEADKGTTFTIRLPLDCTKPPRKRPTTARIMHDDPKKRG